MRSLKSMAYTPKIPSTPDVASRFPSVLQVTLPTAALWPDKLNNSFPVPASHSFAVLSSLPAPAASHPGENC